MKEFITRLGGPKIRLEGRADELSSNPSKENFDSRLNQGTFRISRNEPHDPATGMYVRLSNYHLALTRGAILAMGKGNVGFLRQRLNHPFKLNG